MSGTSSKVLAMKENLSEIKAKLREISSLYSEAKPSEVVDVYWIYAERKKGAYPASTEKSGKWLIFVPIGELDTFWEKIKIATEKGILGNSAKVATAKPNPNAASSAKVICVYTYDWSDEKDVMRVREELKKLGAIRKIPYKSDGDTLARKYVNRGNTRISKYYC
ncbi:MAG: putative phosphothreonine lyase domain-containing protein [Candidatus Micrarchaeota archaeon]